MTSKLVFWTAFNSYQSSKCLRGMPEGSVHPVQTEDWTAYRADLWRKLTLNSLFNQTHEDFLYVVLLDPELRHLTDRVLPKHPDKRGGRVLYCYRDEPVLRMLREYDEIVFALIDNDDMYARDAGALMMDCPARWMYFKHGYAFDYMTRKVWEYDTIGSGPFFAHRTDPKTIRLFDRSKRHPVHKSVIDAPGLIELPPGRFCVTLHEANTSSTSDMRYVLRDKPVKYAVLKREFGK